MHSREKKYSSTHQNTDTSFPNQETLTSHLYKPTQSVENPRDGGTWWAAVYGIAQSRTRLKRFSSDSSSHGNTWDVSPKGGGLCPRAECPARLRLHQDSQEKASSRQPGQEPTPDPPTTHAGLKPKEIPVCLLAGPHTEQHGPPRSPSGGVATLRWHERGRPRSPDREHAGPRAQATWGQSH